MEIIYRGKTWVTKDFKEIKYRNICNLTLDTKKSLVKRIKINDDDMVGIISRMMYAFQVYQTKSHDLNNCECTGCRYARNCRYYLGTEICENLVKNW